MLADNEIRVLDLLHSPSVGDTPIVCELRAIPLSAKADYEALSYVWGDETATETIEVSGRQVTITPSLLEALRRLRSPTQKRTLWIDQLCIEQWNLEEKKQQVQLMRDIYKHCRRCLVWLGEIKEHVSLADAARGWEVLTYLAAANGAEDPSEIPMPWAASGRETALYDAIKALRSSSEQEHPWWDRIWTVQEATIPEEVLLLWGPLALPWETLTQAAATWIDPGCPYPLSNLLTPETETILSGLMVHVIWLNIAKDRLDGKPLDIVNRWRFRKSTDPRDKIYGLMGLCELGALPVTEKCDYFSPASSVFRTLTLELMISERDLRPLIANPRIDPDKATPGISSWVLDLVSIGPSYNTDWYYHSYGYEEYDAARPLRPLDPSSLGMQYHAKTLSLAGVRVDKVALVESGYRTKTIANPNVPDEDIERIVRAWYDVVKGSRKYKNNKVLPRRYIGARYTSAKAFARLVLGDLVRDYNLVPIREATAKDISAVFRFLDSCEVSSDIRLTIYSMVANQSFFTTKMGLMGTGHVDTQPGDEVWVLRGGKIPFVLRPSENDGETEYTFIGQGYVQGAMQGEIFQRGICNVNTEQTIHII
ncbi:heterokaryon incompatibility protein-domain-containing protein [Truncatella angustata]|uniref:Heterokaryon incompatibility protein-domain-containing protein n=1 Tax=Truncatella angustata TaxID=152316 RepID=A0A9P8ZV27_9PEZI|nr:heterokaryon incompatibility protein-domain-containing protein [Truncatella angustata]KAH6651675.1 heterokaryon incompatibility protein-domain-containing protein [Truncatella angustata]